MGNIIRKITNINTPGWWDRELGSLDKPWRSFVYEYIPEFLPKDSAFSLLDIGCALGDGCLLLKKYFPQAEISGADFSKIGIGKARQKTNAIDFFELDIIKKDPAKKYDYIIMVSTLEHFNNPYPVVNRCLKFVNRALIIQVPYTEKFDAPQLYGKGQHRYLFNEKSFTGYNFKILKITEMIKSTGYQYIIYELVPSPKQKSICPHSCEGNNARWR